MGGQTLQLPVLWGIFKANLEEAADIGDINVLAEVAEKVGMMSKDEVRCQVISVGFLFHCSKAVNFLKSDELNQEINEMCEKARDMGIKGVPLTIIDGKWALSGGQSSDVFVQVCLPSIISHL
jgi:predicted DsbA family dithiol-disulfide isomerase